MLRKWKTKDLTSAAKAECLQLYHDSAFAVYHGSSKTSFIQHFYWTHNESGY
jgi:hypothetical protein